MENKIWYTAKLWIGTHSIKIIYWRNLLYLYGTINIYTDDKSLLLSHKKLYGVNVRAWNGFSKKQESFNDRNHSLNVWKNLCLGRFQLIKRYKVKINIAIHRCVLNKTCNPHNWKIIKKVEKIRYSCIIFDNNFRWNYHINNILVWLRFITY